MTIFRTAQRSEVQTVSLGIHTVPLFESRRTADGCGYASVPVGTRSAVVNVRIDFAKLNRFAIKALRSRSGKCTLADGAIKFIVDPTTIDQLRTDG